MSTVSFKTHEKSNNVIVVDCPNRLDANVSPALKKIMTDLNNEKKFKVIVNLSDTDYIDSSGLGAILSRISVSRSNKGDVRIVTKSKSILDLLDITRLNKIIKCYQDVKTAENSFNR
jgi:anti-sigma B factor antagonist